MLVVCSYCGAEVPLPPLTCERCTAPLTASAVAPHEPAPLAREGAPPIALHPMGEMKLVLMSLCTLGLYELYWFYRNWVLRRDVRGRDVIPALRALFSHFTSFTLFEEVEDEAAKVGVRPGWGAAWLGVAYFALWAITLLPGEFWGFAVLLGPIVLLPVQRTINRANERTRQPVRVNDRFSTANVVALVLGGLLLLLVVIGIIFFPEG